jgi:peroxiredoxin
MACRVELGKLEANYQEFEERKTRIVAVSLEDREKAQTSQKEFPHLVMVADTDRKMCEALQVIHERSAPGRKDTAAPTTFLVDGSGTIRWMFRPERHIIRLSPAEVLAAVDRYMPSKKTHPRD